MSFPYAFESWPSAGIFEEPKEKKVHRGAFCPIHGSSITRDHCYTSLLDKLKDLFVLFRHSTAGSKVNCPALESLSHQTRKLRKRYVTFVRQGNSVTVSVKSEIKNKV